MSNILDRVVNTVAPKATGKATTSSGRCVPRRCGRGAGWITHVTTAERIEPKIMCC